MRSSADQGGGRTAPVARFVQSLLSALIALWVLAALASFLFDVDPVYTLCALGLLFAGQATWYKHRLAVDPSFVIPGCKCGSAAGDRTEAVLTSAFGSIRSVPISLIGVAAYVLLLLLARSGQLGTAVWVAAAALAVSMWLAFVMVSRIRALCSLCISTCAVNILLVWYLVR
jgi:uncharacterized membrane protein